MADFKSKDVAAWLATQDNDARDQWLRQVRSRMAVNVADPTAALADVTRMREYLDKPIPIPPSLVWPTIAVRGEITTTLGRAGKGKTTMNLVRIFAWSAGLPLFPGWKGKDTHRLSPQYGDFREYLKPEKPLKTLIAENEGNAGMFQEKVQTMLDHGPLTKDQREQALDNLFVHGDGGYSGLKLDNDEGVVKMRAAIEQCEPDIVFIEPFRSLWSGEENSSTDMTKVVDNIISMATDYDCAVILSHHEKKGGDETGEKMSRARGSTVLEGAVAVMENFESVQDGLYREMTWSKARYLPPPTPVRMEYDRDSGWLDWVPSDVIEDQVMAKLREADDEPMNLSALSEETGETKAKLRPIVGKLVEDKKVKKMPAISGAGGSTGIRYRLPMEDNETGSGGLGL